MPADGLAPARSGPSAPRRIALALAAAVHALALADAVCSNSARADAAPAGVLRLMPGVPIVIDPAEPEAARRAVEDLRRDLEKVFGAPSPLVDSAADAAGQPAIIATATGPATAAFREIPLAGREAHAIRVVAHGDTRHVVLQGADARGLIYAVYAFSDQVLDIPPLWFWAGWQPPRTSAIDLPATLDRRIGPARVRWRAWFPNNSDFLRGWVAETDADADDADDALFETLLRLKMNTLDVGEDLIDRSGQATRRVRAAHARGLVVTSPFLGSLRDWPDGVEQSSTELRLDNIAGLEEFWSARIAALQDERIEMLWGIGFRGTSDEGFAASFPDAPAAPAQQGAIVTAMLARQLALLRRLTDDPHPPVRTEIYSEVQGLFADGHFRPPADPDLIWHFANESRDHHPGDDLLGWRPPFHRRLGYYMNLQFTSTGSHYAEGEGPWKMARNFRWPEDLTGAPLEVTKVNIGNLREFMVSLSAQAALAWDGADAPIGAVTNRVFARYFAAAASKVAALYRRLIESYWQQRRPDIPGFERQFIFHDLRLGLAITQLLELLEEDRFSSAPFEADRFRIDPRAAGAGGQLEALIGGTERSARLRARLVAHAKQLRSALPEGQRLLFDDLVTHPAALLLALDRAAAALARATRTRPPRERARARVGAELAAATAALGAAVDHLAAAERAPFEGWYSRPEILDLRELHERSADLAESFD